MTTVGLLFLLAGVIGSIDALLHPASEWAYADRNKSFWVIVMLLGGAFGASVYLVAVRPRFGGSGNNPFLK